MKNAFLRGASALALVACLAQTAQAGTTYMWQYDSNATSEPGTQPTYGTGTTTGGSNGSTTGSTTGAGSTGTTGATGGTTSGSTSGGTGTGTGATAVKHPFTNPVAGGVAAPTTSQSGTGGTGSTTSPTGTSGTGGATTGGTTGTGTTGTSGAGTAGNTGTGAGGTTTGGSGTGGSGGTGAGGGSGGPIGVTEVTPIVVANPTKGKTSLNKGDAYTAAYTASGGTAPFTFSWSMLDPGLSTRSTATSTVLSGVPTSLGANAPMTLTVTDSSSPSQTKTVQVPGFALLDSTPSQDPGTPVGPQLTVEAEPNFRTTVVDGTGVSAGIVTSGGSGSYTYDIEPPIPGLTGGMTNGWNPSYEVSGTLPVGHYGDSVITVTDAADPTLKGQVRLDSFDVVAKAPLPLTAGLSSELPTRQNLGDSVAITLSIAGGHAPYAVTPTLDPGFTFTPSADTTSGELDGQPTDLGDEPAMTFFVTDSSTPQQSTTVRTNAYKVVDPSDASQIKIVANYPLAGPEPVGGTAYGSYSFSGGTGNYTITPNDMPDGVTFNNTYLLYQAYGFAYDAIGFSYSPTQLETLPGFSFTVSDDAGASATYAVNPITSIPSQGGPLALTANQDFPNQMQPGVQADAHVYVSGGQPPYHVVSLDPIDAGFALPSNPYYGSQFYDVIGTPTKVGNNAPMTLTVGDSAGASVSLRLGAFTLLPPPPIVITATADLPDSVPLGTGVSANYAFSGGVRPYTLSYSAGDPPVDGTADPGLDIQANPYSGFAISGNPTQLGLNNGMNLTVTDAFGQVKTFTTKPFEVVQLGDADHIAINPDPDLPATASYGEPVFAHYEVFGGTPPYRLTSTTLPSGLFVLADQVDGRSGRNIDSWEVLGYPNKMGANAAGSLTFVDAANHSVTVQTTAMTVADTGSYTPLTVSGSLDAGSNMQPGQEPVAALGSEISGYYYANGGIGPVHLTVSGSYPGVYAYLVYGTNYSRLSNEQIAFAGSPSAIGESTTFTVTATDAVGTTVSQQVQPFQVTADAAPPPKPLSFVKTGTIGNVRQGDPVSVPFQVVGGTSYTYPGGYQYPVYISYTMVGGPKGLSFGAADSSLTASLQGYPAEAGTFSPVVIASDNYSTSVVYQMPTFTVSPAPVSADGGLCAIKQFGVGQPPTELQGNAPLSYDYAQVGCGTAPYIAVVTSGDANGATIAAPFYGTDYPCFPTLDGVIAAISPDPNGGSTTVSNVTVTVYDANGKYIVLDPLTGAVPSDGNNLFGYCYV